MLTKEQQTVFDWINDNLQLPVFADAYKGALDLLNRKSPGYITLVSHVGRDLMNILVKVVNKRIEGGWVEYKKLVDEFQDDWKDEWEGEGFHPAGDVPKEHLIPNEICKKIKKLIDEHTKGSLRNASVNSLFFSTFLGYKDGVKIGKNFFSEWKNAKDWFMAHAHLREGDFSENEASEVEMYFQTLENFLYDAATSEFGRVRIINDILEETNKQNDN